MHYYQGADGLFPLFDGIVECFELPLLGNTLKITIIRHINSVLEMMCITDGF